MWAKVSFVLSQSTRFADRRTDERTNGKALEIPYVAYRTVKTAPPYDGLSEQSSASHSTHN